MMEIVLKQSNKLLMLGCLRDETLRLDHVLPAIQTCFATSARTAATGLSLTPEGGSGKNCSMSRGARA